MTLPNKSIFFGSSYRIAQLVDRICPLSNIFCEKRQFNTDIFNLSRILPCEFTLISRKSELDFSKLTGQIMAVSFGFGIIFNQKQIDALPYGIWNIHTGKLPELRGRHPITWAFLNGHKDFVLSIHEMNAEIDQGFLLAEGSVKRDLNDTQEDIENKFDALLEHGLLQTAYENYFAGKKVAIDKGTYTKSLVGGFTNIVPEEIESAFLFNLCKAQAKYGGIEINGKKYIECVFIHDNFPELYTTFEVFVCKDQVKIGLA